MNDLIKRLRDEHQRNGGQGAYAWNSRELCGKAADRLTAMKAAGHGLAGFAGHKWTCRANGPMPQCDCGLTNKLKQWKEPSDGL